MALGRANAAFYARLDAARGGFGSRTWHRDRTSGRLVAYTYSAELRGQGLLTTTIELPGTLRISVADSHTGWNMSVSVKQADLSKPASARSFTYFVEPGTDDDDGEPTSRPPSAWFAKSMAQVRAAVARRLGGTSVLLVSPPGRPEHYSKTLGFGAVRRG